MPKKYFTSILSSNLRKKLKRIRSYVCHNRQHHIMPAHNYINNRMGTIIYEISKVLANVVEEPSDDDKALKNKLLHMNNKCEYCEIYPASTTDHFANLVKDSKPTENCSDFWNLIPCCSSCNSSKGGKSFFEWANSPKNTNKSKNPFHHMVMDKKETIITKFIEYDKVFQERKYIKIYDMDEYNEISKYLAEVMGNVQSMANKMKDNTKYQRPNCSSEKLFQQKSIPIKYKTKLKTKRTCIVENKNENNITI